jgi:hypothetical protein
MRIAISLAFLFLVTGGAAATAQMVARAPSGTLRGVVQDSATAEPVAYALVMVVGRDQRAFASESGRFSLTGVPAGTVRLRVQQIGYRARILILDVDSRPTGDAPTLVVRLARQVFVLPDLTAEGKACLDLKDVSETAPEGGQLLGEAIANAERILMLERKYPFILHFQRFVALLDTGYNTVKGQVDSLRKDSRTYVPYRVGKVLERSFGREHLATFTTSDFAGAEFQGSHCFRYAGRDSLEGFGGYRIDFTPRPEVTTPDWAGSMLVDAATMDLLRTETRLVNLPRSGTDFLSANCVIFYQPIVPSLPQESQVRCETTQRGGRTPIRVERWRLVSSRFVGKSPVGPERPQ